MIMKLRKTVPHGTTRAKLRPKGVFQLTTNAMVPVKRVFKVNTYEFQLSHDGVSKVNE